MTDRREELATRLSRLVVALVLAAIGIVWIGQGTGYIGGSAMTGSTFWAAVGAFLLAVVVVVVLVERRVARPR
jgi:membrane protein implicated in regulation of membrane protease activity